MRFRPEDWRAYWLSREGLEHFTDRLTPAMHRTDIQHRAAQRLEHDKRSFTTASSALPLSRRTVSGGTLFWNRSALPGHQAGRRSSRLRVLLRQRHFKPRVAQDPYSFGTTVARLAKALSLIGAPNLCSTATSIQTGTTTSDRAVGRDGRNELDQHESPLSFDRVSFTSCVRSGSGAPRFATDMRAGLAPARHGISRCEPRIGPGKIRSTDWRESRGTRWCS